MIAEAAPDILVPDALVPDALVIGAYVTTLALLASYGLHRSWMLARFRWKVRPDEALRPSSDAEPPFVTVQLPLYNERTVAARLIRAAGELDWPRHRLEIQVLDDSTDETRTIVDEAVARLVANGVDARVVRRADRVGFKAGALEHGMRTARGELLCVFDADFVPNPDFLRRTVPRFDDPAVGMVQARWEHENRDESFLTRAQSTLLDGHFVIEHKVRFDQGLFFNFNGTAGLWRRRAIEEAGGWQHDTLTEDLDLSYRAQLAGWRFAYAHDVTAPAEVPSTIAAFKSQQHRWAKGSVQVARKLGRRIATSEESWRVKREAFAHLTGNSGYPLVLAMAVFMPPAVFARGGDRFASFHLATFLLCTLSVFLFYERSQRALGRPLARRLRDALGAIVLGIGMCVSQTRAVFEGLFHETGAFIRTPKRGERSLEPYEMRLGGVPIVELLFAAWFTWGVVHAAQLGLWGAIPFLALFLAGFAWVGGLSLRAWFAAR